MEFKTVLVTGAAGFIGYHLSKRLLKSGCKVVGLDNMNDYYDVGLKYARFDELKKLDGFSFIRCDIADREAISRVFDENTPQAVVNLAAQAGVRYSLENPQVYIDSNIVGFFNVLECCRSHPVQHLVYASSSSVYGNSEKIPFSVEDNVDRPISLYAATKKSNELMAYTYSHLFGIPATGLRFFTVYGPFGRPDMAYFSFTKRILSGETIKLFNNGDLQRDFTYIDDIVSGISLVLSSPPEFDGSARSKVYNIGNNKPVAIKTFLRTLENALGKIARVEYLPMQPGDVYRTYADISGLESDFGFAPSTDIKTGLESFVEWYREFYNVK